ncbi:TraR/DksA C4-type zinc finger protein [Sulfurimonas sp. HSL-3221]|uniref:TraR/DksA family transcriptional regulator n=1 Tax=Thiomicrolovo sulfuroxydans TaxID=2894755 RepID=UPI001E63BB72|nr:TraR/DksA C4-type zinc finger protein [Sulfurimonas sp. HSL-3221]UFS61491.1 TraR/DksA C4-type zinc finger protein [Sulfurimonas sp. HSL-3221]
MTTEAKAALRLTLEAAAAKTADEIAQLEPQLEPIAPDCCLGELTRAELMGEQEVAAKAYEAALRRKNRLAYALSRIDSEDFGLCEACDEPIAPARLALMPEATLCVACANERGE